jgi:hypothetical protein
MSSLRVIGYLPAKCRAAVKTLKLFSKTITNCQCF